MQFVAAAQSRHTAYALMCSASQVAQLNGAVSRNEYLGKGGGALRGEVLKGRGEGHMDILPH